MTISYPQTWRWTQVFSEQREVMSN
jgi:hypothetical protein